jgi:hypothetical protein
LVDPTGVIKSWFDANLVLFMSWNFPGIRLYLYEKRSE